MCSKLASRDTRRILDCQLPLPYLVVVLCARLQAAQLNVMNTLGCVVQVWVCIVGSCGDIRETSIDLLVCRDVSWLAGSQCGGGGPELHGVVCSTSRSVRGPDLID